jgi:3-hydroxyacyl-CoA dehydrogenase/enoyl-CoA hydratase/3-hydroxybutyryl-CoA epimerase
MINTLILNKPKEELDNSEISIFKKSFIENYAAEGARLLINGASAVMIENAGKRLGFKLGPLATADNREIQCIIAQLDSTDASVAALIRSMQKINRNGLSSNKGFYDYKDGKIKNIWNELNDMIPPAKIQPSIKEIEDRLLYSTINNIFYNYIKYSELKNHEMYDYMAINNIGFPEWTGGPFRWVKQNGVESFIKNNDEYAKTLGSRFVINNKIINVIENL